MAGEIQRTEPKQNWLVSTREYIDGLKKEMRLVTWPSRKQVEATTAVVIISVFAFALYFKLVDLVIENTVTRMYSALSK